MTTIKPPKVPCGSCPYRRDVPSGIWDREEYEKLRGYDAPTYRQPIALFMCHQQDGCLCGGWLLTHDAHELLAVRLHAEKLDPSVWSYNPPVPVFQSSAAAAKHGMRDVDNPSPAALRKIDGLIKQRGEG